MRKAGPTAQRSFTETQLWKNLPVEFVKYDVCRNGVRIHGIDARRIDEIVFQIAMFPVSAALPTIGNEPKNILQQVRAGNGTHFVPHQRAGLRLLTSLVMRHVAQILDSLRINVNLRQACRNSFQLFDDASLRAMAAIEKWCDYRNTHVSASECTAAVESSARSRIARRGPDAAGGIIFPASARSTHSQ